MFDIKKFIETKFRHDIRAHNFIDHVEGTYREFPSTLHPELRDALLNQGIQRLYSHQAEAFDLISKNKDTLLVSSTASGKTLSFFLPVFNEYIHEKKPFTVLLMYPTKALSRDQESTFGALMNVVKKTGSLGTFDGDTPREERVRIQKFADFIITNPDMLHNGILPNHHRRWKAFLSRLRYIIVDEVHIYRGSFGSHVSNVFRRLLRICRLHGSNPAFICSSATVGNPGGLVKALFHRDFEVINKDGAPKTAKNLYCINPPLIKSHGYASYRKGPTAVSVPILRAAAKNRIRTICFCRARQQVERLYRAVTDGRPEYKTLIKPYRGGLLPNERRKLERDLAEGKTTVVITTNALELGIDIGDLDLCLLTGHPGTLASFWQQAGRVGRKQNEAVIVYIAKNSPIDQYLVHHPEFILKGSIEQAWLSADNPYILLQHLPCAANEYPLREQEEGFDPFVYEGALEILKEQKTVVPYRSSYRYALQDYPSRGVNLRGMTDYNVEIYCGTEVIGEIDAIGARGSLYKDAIYQHLGRRYMSMDLDLEKKLCRVEPVEVDYFTEAVWEGRVEMTEVDEETVHNGAALKFGNIYINIQPKMYKKIRERSYENIGYGPITLPPFEYETTGFSILPSPEWVRAIEQVDKRYISAALYGLSYLIKHSSVSLCMADINDIDTSVSLAEKDDLNWQSTLYVFDTIEGGVGYAEKIFEQVGDALRLCDTLIEECECESGCPACVPPLPPGIDNDELALFMVESNAATQCTLSLLKALIKNEIVLPQISYCNIEIKPEVDEHPVDMEKIKLGKKLARAAKNLKNKREKLH